MNPLNHSPLLSSLFAIVSLISFAVSANADDPFLQCLFTNDSSISSILYTPTNSSYTAIYESRIQNLRFDDTNTTKPLAIITALRASHVQATIICARNQSLQVLIRSGGHDYEGLSYVSTLPFVMLDLINLRNITIDAANETAWVEPGATVGEFYYAIAQTSTTLAFPAGTCPTVGLGGYISGGGFGYLMRKYGLAADNVLDALLVDANGRLLDRASMGEDLFWAIRGGGGNTFGVVISWKVNLVSVPSTVTYFRLTRSLEQNATQLIHRWQYVASNLTDDLNIYAIFINQNSTRVASFESVYLGGTDNLLAIMGEWFPELGLTREDCSEMSWIQSQITLALYPSNSSLGVLLNRNITTVLGKEIFKGKSDYVKVPMPEAAIEGLIQLYSAEPEINFSTFYFVPYGGKMDEIAETSIPFPHRAGNLYMIGYYFTWDEGGAENTTQHLDYIRSIYTYMTPFVSQNPREAYFNYRDLDIGTNNLTGNTSYQQASIWGTKYFKDNFDRLVQVKTRVDPSNFFRNAQSIPPLSS